MRTLSIILVALVVGACASTGGRSATRQRNLITLDEIEATNQVTAYEVVQKLRPEFLRARGAASIRSPQPERAIVYIDGVRAGGLDILRTVPREILYEIEYLSGPDATTLYGIGHGGGAIQVVTRRG